MNIPLSWLAEYVALPKSEAELTDKLTMVGHMLNKRWQTPGGEVVIDLELRGNRSDLFAIIGVAREVSAIWNTPLKTPSLAKLPEIKSNSDLVIVKSPGLVERFLAFKLKVTVEPSPDWLVKRLSDYGIPSINNVVDITNFVMVETGEPMHAYDTAKLAGKKLILRQAKKGEKFITLLGTDITLDESDLVISDEEIPQGLTMIGGKNSGVSNETTEVILEAAVYNQANVRRTARKLNIFTEAGTRHDKLLDPNQVEFALARALELLTKHANAKVVGEAFDFYPKKRHPKTINLKNEAVLKLTGVDVKPSKQESILKSIGCDVEKLNSELKVVAPTFRTDIEQSADLVEEIIRIYGYEEIPAHSLFGETPAIQTSKIISFENNVRDGLVRLGINEVITSPLVHTDKNAISIINPPDPDFASLRTNLTDSLINYAKRCQGFRVERIALFEIGKTYHHDGKKYQEELKLALALSGKTGSQAWGVKNRPMSIYDLIGTIEALCEILNVEILVNSAGAIINKELGVIGNIFQAGDIFVAELSLEKIADLPKTPIKNYLAPAFPPIIEDMSFGVSKQTEFGQFMKAVTKISQLISRIELVDLFEKNRTIRVTYISAQRTLTEDDIKPIRNEIISLAKNDYSSVVRTVKS